MHRASRYLGLIPLCIGVLSWQSPSDGSRIRLVSSRQISGANASRPHVESFIAVNPRDARNIVAAAIVYRQGDAGSRPYVSFDGGATWAAGRLPIDSTIEVDADPIVYFTHTGTAFFSALGSVEGVNRTLIFRSTDGGRTWGRPTVLPMADRQWMAFDSTRGPFGGRAYFTGTGVITSRDGGRATAPFLVISDDDGKTFPMRSVVAYDRGGPDPDKPINAVPLEALVTPSGLLILTLQTGSAERLEELARDSLDARSVGLIVSNDGGESFGPARIASVDRIYVTGSAYRRHRSTSADGSIRAAIDASSGRYRNRIYMVASAYDRHIDRYVVQVWRTADFGKSWETTVASDAPNGDVANPAIAVNRDGVVAVVWNDRRDDPRGSCWQLYAAISVDGGEKFLPAKRLSTKPSCTNSPGNWETFGSSFNSTNRGQPLAHVQSGAGVPARFPMGGDTQGLAADATGVFHAGWINGETGVLQLWHTRFEVEPALVAQLRGGSTGPDSTAPAMAGWEDVTRDVGFKVTSTKLDFATRTHTLTVEIENRSGRPIRTPLRAVMREFLNSRDQGMGLKNLAVSNADSGGTGVGATWIFDAPGGVLAPRGRSKPRVLRFTFEGGVPAIPLGYLSPGFQVLAPLQ